MNYIHQIMQFAYKKGEIVSIQDVPRGVECGCNCSACGAVLVAKKVLNEYLILRIISRKNVNSDMKRLCI